MRVPLLVVAALVAAPAVAHAGDGKNLLGLVPEDARSVQVVDVADAHDAKTYRTLMDKVASTWPAATIDDAVKTVLVASSDAGKIIVVEGAALPAHDGAAAHKHRGVTYYDVDLHEVAMVGKRLVVTDPGLMDGVIDRQKKKAKSMLKSPKAAALRAAIDMTDTRQHIWWAAGPTTYSGMSVDGFSIGFTLSDNVVVQGKVHAADAATAAQWQTEIDGKLPQLVSALQMYGMNGLADSLAIGTDGDIVQLDCTLPGAELDILVGLLSSFI